MDTDDGKQDDDDNLASRIVTDVLEVVLSQLVGDGDQGGATTYGDTPSHAAEPSDHGDTTYGNGGHEGKGACANIINDKLSCESSSGNHGDITQGKGCHEEKVACADIASHKLSPKSGPCNRGDATQSNSCHDAGVANITNDRSSHDSGPSNHGDKAWSNGSHEGDGVCADITDVKPDLELGDLTECPKGPDHQKDVTEPIADPTTLETTTESTHEKVERVLSTRSSRILEVHIPGDAMNTVECSEPHRDEREPIMRPAALVSQSYPPTDPLPQDHPASHVDTRSPSSRLIQLPLMGPSSGGPRRGVTPALARSKTLSDLISERQKTPACVSRMSAVLQNTRARAEKQRRHSAFLEEKSQRKLLSLDQCINSRPPMPFDLDNPGPCRYSPPSKPLAETNSPKYTFGHRFYERGGGGRTAWAKSWFNSRDNQTIKVNFEKKWPSPAAHLGSRSLVGRKLPSKPTYPSFTFGAKSKLSINKRGSDKEPSPNEYDPARADGLMYRRAPAFGMTFRHKGTSLWRATELTPAPDIYTPQLSTMSSRPHRPAFTIQGIRRPKSHALGPYATF